jgi:hypothetical protein
VTRPATGSIFNIQNRREPPARHHTPTSAFRNLGEIGAGSSRDSYATTPDSGRSTGTEGSGFQAARLGCNCQRPLSTLTCRWSHSAPWQVMAVCCRSADGPRTSAMWRTAAADSFGLQRAGPNVSAYECCSAVVKPTSPSVDDPNRGLPRTARGASETVPQGLDSEIAG